MTSTEIPPTAQRLSAFPCCAHCSKAIAIGTTRGRRFCADACRQAAYRGRQCRGDETARELPPQRTPKNNAPGAESDSKTSTISTVEIRNKTGGSTALIAADAAPVNLLGGRQHWASTPALGLRLAQKILDAEIGDGGQSVTSAEGVVSKVRRR